MSKLQTEIDLSTLHYEYVKLSHSVRALLPLKIMIKEIIENLGIDSEKMKFVSNSTLYEDNNGAIVVETNPSMTSTSKKIAVRYHWFRHHLGKEFVIHNIESENQKADIFTKVLQGDFFSGLGSCYAVCKPSDERECIKKWHIQPSTETLFSERRYFGPLGNDHILVYYPLIYYQRIKVYRFETMNMGRFRWNNGVSGKCNPIKYSGIYCTG